MKQLFNLPGQCLFDRYCVSRSAILVAATGAAGLLAIDAAAPAFAESKRYCSQTAHVLFQGCRHDSRDDYSIEKAICINITGRDERRDCLSDALHTLRESRRECGAVRKARLQLCNNIGQDRYDPSFGGEFAARFVDPTSIGTEIAPNPWFPLVEGNEWVYSKVFEDDEGDLVTETITVQVTEKTKLIQGVTCVVVKDLVEEDGSLIEDTDDWYAQDVEGNVWYCGEIALNFESFEGDVPEDPEVTDIDGSWKAGRDGAKAGILFPANPEVGAVIRQEVAWSEAEDVIEVVSVTGTESAPSASCSNNCLVTEDFTPLEPGAIEQKFYAPGVGLILEVDAEGDRLELISHSIN